MGGDWWYAPTTKHAYWLAVIGVVLELFAAAGGVAVYFVSPFVLIHYCDGSLHVLVPWTRNNCTVVKPSGRRILT